MIKQSDWDRIREEHDREFAKSGAVPKALFWGKGKQKLRFFQLIRDVEIEKNSKILDLGCGFADLYSYIVTVLGRQIQYTGIDISEQFCAIAQSRYQGIEVIHANFRDLVLDEKRNFDFIFISGALNYRLNNMDNYEYVNKIIENFLPHTNVLAMDFLSDKVDYEMPEYYYYNPSKILELGYRYSKNLLLRNDCMPFEFSMIIRKDDSFPREKTTFNTFLTEKGNLFEESDFDGGRKEID